MIENSLAYDLFMLPLELSALRQLRKSYVPQAAGRVLEIGAGTGANLPFYSYAEIGELHLLDLEISGSLQKYPFPGNTRIEFHKGDAQALPFPANFFDAVVSTLVFCSVPDPLSGLQEVLRVLKPGGQYRFIEHVVSHHRTLGQLMNRIAPLWHSFSGGCNLNRDTERNIRTAGFSVNNIEYRSRGIFIAGTASAGSGS